MADNGWRVFNEGEEVKMNSSALVLLQSHLINSQDAEIKQDDPAEFWVTGTEPPFNGEAFPACGPQSSGRTNLSKGWVKID